MFLVVWLGIEKIVVNGFTYIYILEKKKNSLEIFRQDQADGCDL